MLATRHSPMTRLARRIPWAAGSPTRETASTFAAFALVPTAVFWTWYLCQGRHGIAHGYRGLVWAMPITSLWITLAPTLMQRGEFALERLLETLEAVGEDGWDTGGMRRAMDRADRWYYPTVLPIASAALASVWIGGPSIGSVVEVRGEGARIGGLVVVSAVGFASASGMWGCYKALAVIRAATRRVPSQWLPFRSHQANGLSELHRFCWTTALTFSSGSVSLPTLFAVQAGLPPVSRQIVLGFVAVLGLGGLVLFTVPIRWLRRIGSAQRDAALDALAPAIERGRDAVLRPGLLPLGELRRRQHALEMALRLRAEIAALNPVPLPQLVTRGAATLLLPLLLTVLQLAVARVL